MTKNAMRIYDAVASVIDDEGWTVHEAEMALQDAQPAIDALLRQIPVSVKRQDINADAERHYARTRF